MACAREQGLRRTELQIEPILPEGYGVLRALRAVLSVLRVAFELKRAMEKRYPRSRE
jgi:hypothetical protein